MANNYGSVLSDFKKNEDPSSLIPVMNNEKLKNGLVAWKSTTVKLDGGVTEIESYCDNEKWSFLWKSVRVDLAMFSSLSGLSGTDGTEIFQRLKGLRLIYPDGTISNYAKQYLTSLVIQELQKGKKKEPGRPKK